MVARERERICEREREETTPHLRSTKLNLMLTSEKTNISTSRNPNSFQWKSAINV